MFDVIQEPNIDINLRVLSGSYLLDGRQLSDRQPTVSYNMKKRLRPVLFSHKTANTQM